MKKERTATGSRRPLPDYIQRALRTGERTWKTNGYSRNHLVFSIAKSACQHGWELQDFIDAILDPRNLAGEKHQAMNRVKAEKILEKDWESAVASVMGKPAFSGAEAIRERMKRTAEVVQSIAFPGRTGNTDRHVLLTIINLAVEVGTYTPAFSTRTLAIAANKRQETVSKSLARLRQAGYLELITPATHNKSAVYQVTIPIQENGSLTSNTKQSIKRPAFKDSIQDIMSHDVFSAGSLGATAGRLWTELDSREYTVNQMADAIGLSVESCRVAANKLVSVGLMSKSEGRPARYTVEAPYGYDISYLDQIMSVGEDMWEDESPDLTDSVGRGDRRSDRYRAQQTARKIQFNGVYDEASGTFVDSSTGEVIDHSALLPLDVPESVSESLPDFLLTQLPEKPHNRPEAA